MSDRLNCSVANQVFVYNELQQLKDAFAQLKANLSQHIISEKDFNQGTMVIYQSINKFIIHSLLCLCFQHVESITKLTIKELKTIKCIFTVIQKKLMYELKLLKTEVKRKKGN